MKERLKAVLLWIWQAPQNIAGLLLIAVFRAEKKEAAGIVYYDAKMKSGVSLGNYILLDRRYYPDDNTVKHEHGHQIQSRWLGPVYLLTVGIVSASRNIWDRIAHKNWTYAERHQWYYSAWPEDQANRLGGVSEGWM